MVAFDNTLQKYKPWTRGSTTRGSGAGDAASAAVPVVTPPVMDAHKHLCRDGNGGLPIRRSQPSWGGAKLTWIC